MTELDQVIMLMNQFAEGWLFCHLSLSDPQRRSLLFVQKYVIRQIQHNLMRGSSSMSEQLLINLGLARYRKQY